MIRFTPLSVLIVLACFLAGCQKLKPESVHIASFPDLKVLRDLQADLLEGKSVEKTVTLGDESEFNQLKFDSTEWGKELDFLEEINPNQREYIGAFSKSETGSSINLKLNKGEKGALKSLTYSIINKQYQYINASLHENKDVYIHHREIAMKFKDGLLSSYKIDGYQKMLFKDTVRFGISGEVLK